MKTAIPGTAFDCGGFPIEPGDLLRTFHFRDRFRHGRINYLYHVATIRDGYLWAIPVEYMAVEVERTGGCFWILEGRNEAEIIHGLGPEVGKCWYERKPSGVAEECA